MNIDIKKKGYTTLVIVILSVLYFYVINSNVSKNTYSFDDIRTDVDEFEQFVDVFSFNKTDSVIDIHKNKTPLSSVIHNANIFFVFSGYCCQPCVDKQIGYLNDFHKKNDDNITILAINYSQKDFIIFNQNHELKFPIYNMLSNYMELITIKYPAYIMLSKELEIKSIHFPKNEEPQETRCYLESLTEQYLKNKEEEL